jgi:citronellol/citronellal dehydrogenase
MADACFEILQRDAKVCTGNYFIDDDVLLEAGIEDFSGYQVDPSVSAKSLIPDFFI